MKPTPESLFNIATAAVERKRTLDSLYDRMDSLYFMDNARASDDPSVQYVTMPFATSVVDLIVDLATQMQFAISVPAASEAKNAELDAEQMEAWLRSWFLKNARLSGRNLMGESAFLAAQRGLVCARTLFVDKSIRLPDNEDGEATIAGVPVVLQLRDPRYVYVADSPLGPRYVVEQWERTAGDVRALYPNALDDDVDDDQQVTWTEYWDNVYTCYWCNGEPIKRKGGTVVAHGYGCLPYAFGNARTTPSREPEKRYRPVLSGVENLADTINVWFSIITTAGWASATNAWAVFSDSFTGEQGKELDTSPGAINYFGSSDKVTSIQRATMPGDFFQLGNLLFQAWQTQTFPFSLYGQSSGDIAGYALSLLSQAGRRIILPIWKAIEDMLAQAMINTLVICQNKVAPLVGKQIPLVITTQASPTARRVMRKLKLDVTKFGDDLDLIVTLSDPMPQDTAGNLRMAIESVKASLLSRETALEKFKLSTEPQTEAERIAVEAIWQQVVPFEGIKLAQDRGYIPRNITIPEGFAAGPDGNLIPQALLDAINGAREAEQPPQPQPTPQIGPSSDTMTEQQALPPELQGLDPQTLQRLAAMIRGGMSPAEVGMGNPTGYENVADMQGLAGGQIEPRLEDLAGANNQIQVPLG